MLGRLLLKAVVTVILADVAMLKKPVILIFGAAGNMKHVEVAWCIWCWLLSFQRIGMGAEHPLFCRHYFSSILEVLLIISVGWVP